MTKENKTNRNSLLLQPEEEIEAAKRSKTFIVYVEGKDDLSVYRKVERSFKQKNADKLAGKFIDFEPTQGRTNLFKKIETAANTSNCCFLADQDLFCYKILENYQDPILQHPKLIFTVGYCIENELFADGYEVLYKAVYEDEKDLINAIFEQAARYCAYVCEAYTADCSKTYIMDFNFQHQSYFHSHNFSFSEEFINKSGFKEPQESTTNAMKSDFYSKVRGKFLFDAFQIMYTKRKGTKEEKKIIRSTETLFEDILLHSSSLPRMERIFQKIINLILKS